jgi:hypothetical protein
MRGDDVRWLRQGLEQLAGQPLTEMTGDYFDAGLQQLVENFQRSRRLTVDGVAGLQTQLVLDSALGAPGTPTLSHAVAMQAGRMSFILDALRKSEIERQRQSGPSMAEFPIAREDRRQPVALIAIGVLLAVNVGVPAVLPAARQRRARRRGDAGCGPGTRVSDERTADGSGCCGLAARDNDDACAGGAQRGEPTRGGGGGRRRLFGVSAADLWHDVHPPARRAGPDAAARADCACASGCGLRPGAHG